MKYEHARNALLPPSDWHGFRVGEWSNAFRLKAWVTHNDTKLISLCVSLWRRQGRRKSDYPLARAWFINLLPGCSRFLYTSLYTECRKNYRAMLQRHILALKWETKILIRKYRGYDSSRIPERSRLARDFRKWNFRGSNGRKTLHRYG